MPGRLMVGQQPLELLILVRIQAGQQMERLNINRPEIPIGGYTKTASPFTTGERLSGVYPHSGPRGQKHKGNMEVIDTDGKFSDSGNVGQTGKARCVLPGCGVTIEITATSS